jgi:hypothetical protein
MTDQEIINLMYEYADAFSSCVQFSEANLIAFARAIRDYVPEGTPVARSGYADEMWAFSESVEKYMD